jgi:hypothetical protein
MNSENYNTLIIMFSIVIIIIGVSFFIWDYSKSKLDLSPQEEGYKECVSACQLISTGYEQEQFDEINCINNCYIIYKNETMEDLNE